MIWILIAFMAYSLADAISSRGLFAWPLVYAHFFVATFGTLSWRVAAQGWRIRRIRLSALYMIFVLCNAAMLTFQEPIFWQYVFGDIATLILPAVFFFLFSNSALLSTSNVWLPKLAVASIAIYSLSPLIAEAGLGRNYAPPHLLAMAYPAYAVFTSGNASRVFWWGILIWVTLLALGCGQRTNVVLIGLSFFLFATRFYRPTANEAVLIAGGIVVSATLALAITTIYGGKLQRLAYESSYLQRFTKSGFVMDGSDESLAGRFDEVKDAILSQPHSALQLAIGRGVGASFIIKESNPERNVKESGTVHNMHFGPGMVFYRYGAIGIGLLAASVFIAFRSFFRDSFSLRRPKPEASGQYFLFGILILYLVNFLLRNVMTDPIFSMAIAAVWVGHSLGKKPLVGSRARK